MFTLIFSLILGIFFLGLGWMTWKKEKIELIHSYHHTKVSEENKAPYTKGMGIALIIMGIGMILTGISDSVTGSSYSWIYFVVSIIVGLFMIYRVQKKYNGGLF
ncbi:DUF3784 domain-containing protein [Acidaminobacter sp. JC074]|uniref:DUF3784 domain-containing protein n=1 Tax=Acidaminobacter sp. JC074 TaxID=2530199 RepID=UPI001F0ED678|nr:DUF3784 domain-containing protein [Acidaminobacter sp. JC074]MCH4886268.1 DUF3784 domain-containing protein [Acidaminobacter sp. JC074]